MGLSPSVKVYFLPSLVLKHLSVVCSHSGSALQRRTQQVPAGKENVIDGQGRELQHEVCFHCPLGTGAHLCAGRESVLG